MLPVGECPAVVLYVCKLHPRGARRFGDCQHLFKLLDVVPVDDEIEGYRHAMARQPFQDSQLLRMRRGSRYFAGDLRPGALEAQLKVIETCRHQFLETSLVQWQAR